MKPLAPKEILQQLSGLLTGHWITDLANTAALIFQHVQDVNWVGFYLYESESENILWLGPFQGLPACTMIPAGKGVCGTAAAAGKSIIVEDVDAFTGHIACDARSRSEVVIPLIKNEKVLGVLDVDSATLARFKLQDQVFFEDLIQMLLHANK